MEFDTVPLGRVEHAGSLMDPAVIARWLRKIRTGRAIPPLIVCPTEHNTFYVFDGNHRHQALHIAFSGDTSVPLRVGILRPRAGYQFRYRWFQSYGTYVLEPSSAPPRSLCDVRACFPGHTLVLLAHPDDDMACAGLLQRLPDAIVCYATDGAPQDSFFWRSFSSQREYAQVRRREAAIALANAPGFRAEFLSDRAPALLDQQLYRALSEALDALREAVRLYRPDSLLAPAYEGGHPDHDACSFLGHLVSRLDGVPVWEMPLYHRSPSGTLVTQRFRQRNGTELALQLSPRELEGRRSMLQSYRSQYDLSRFVTAPLEYYRPQAEYDYSQPPHSGRLNYQEWQWPISPAEVCERFRACRHGIERHTSANAQHSPIPPSAEASEPLAVSAGAG
ncbi:MAG: PIG-L family deacetylase [Terriglobales bacterium]